MNFIDTLRSVELVLAAGEVPLLVGETGIGKTSLAHQLAEKHGWTLINIDGNLLKEGEIGGLPTRQPPEGRGNRRPADDRSLHAPRRRGTDRRRKDDGLRRPS